MKKKKIWDKFFFFFLNGKSCCCCRWSKSLLVDNNYSVLFVTFSFPVAVIDILLHWYIVCVAVTKLCKNRLQFSSFSCLAGWLGFSFQSFSLCWSSSSSLMMMMGRIFFQNSLHRIFFSMNMKLSDNEKKL